MLNKKLLEDLYKQYNRREFVHPDPLEFLYNYKNLKDREITGIIASSLAYGRVKQILKGVSWVLDQIGPSPLTFITKTPDKTIKEIFAPFKHRFTTGKELSELLINTRHIIEKHGSLNKCFITAFKDSHPTIASAMVPFAERLTGGNYNSLIPRPDRKSACKRLNLFLRWMVRNDEVDPGGWRGIRTSQLIIPLDTHMHKIGLALGLTKRKNADMKTALEITQGFAKISPEDPVKYDFALTRFGIRDDIPIKSFAKFRGLTKDQSDPKYRSTKLANIFY